MAISRMSVIWFLCDNENADICNQLVQFPKLDQSIVKGNHSTHFIRPTCHCINANTCILFYDNLKPLKLNISLVGLK